jgi:hypothetical protein
MCVSSLWNRGSFIAYKSAAALSYWKPASAATSHTSNQCSGRSQNITRSTAPVGTMVLKYIVCLQLCQHPHMFVVLGLKIGPGFSTVCWHRKKRITKEIPEASLMKFYRLQYMCFYMLSNVGVKRKNYLEEWRRQKCISSERSQVTKQLIINVMDTLGYD